MSTRIVEVSSDGCYLSKDRGFLVIRKKEEVMGKVPIDDIGTLLCCAHGLSYSNNLIQALVENKSSVVFCGDNYMPYAWVLPIGVNHVQSMRFRFQSEASKPLLKQIWKKLIQSKILMQARVLEYLGDDDYVALKKMAQEVRSGDSGNLEARAARYYWPKLLGKEFRRNRNKADANAFLNYGYTVVRSCIARFVVAAGLHPSLGVHHSNRYNTFCLIDDLLEPFRPLVDIRVRKMMEHYTELEQPAKLKLVEVTSVGLNVSEGRSALQNVIETMAILLAGIYETGEIPKDWPLMIPDDRALKSLEAVNK